jgi:ribosomal protein S18 acetylase RimI-like enzyme
MARFLEQFHSAEAALMADFAAAAPSRAQAELVVGEHVRALVAPGVEHPFANHAIVERAGDVEGAAAPLLERFEALGVTRHLLTLPSPGRVDWLARHGLVPFRHWIAFARGTADPAPAGSDLSVVRASPELGTEIGALIARAYGMPLLAGEWIGALVGRRGWNAYAALDGDVVVAAGMLFIYGEVGYAGFAATDPRYRGRGAQSAIIRRRVVDARALGCRVLFSETGEPNGSDRQSSEHNLRRQGFEPIGLRYNYTSSPRAIAAA